MTGIVLQLDMVAVTVLEQVVIMAVIASMVRAITLISTGSAVTTIVRMAADQAQVCILEQPVRPATE